jgi:2-C-methyl-D-erythritol 4-phosphate cytidylyltransferase
MVRKITSADARDQITSDINCTSRYWALITAAGRGDRFGADLPKQYLELCGKAVIEHSLECFCTYEKITGLVVVIDGQDEHGKRLLRAVSTHGKRLIVAEGGVERAQSVLNGLCELAKIAAPQDWVLVHDAARPCLRHADIDSLINALADHPVGGLLGVPVSDTVKRVGKACEVLETVNRDELWRAQTPQMFRIGALIAALNLAMERNINVTDEAAAMALTGAVPLMVESHADNIKITYLSDLALAEFYLRQQGRV